MEVYGGRGDGGVEECGGEVRFVVGGVEECGGRREVCGGRGRGVVVGGVRFVGAGVEE